MRFWLVHSTEVPLREQIVRQVSLGILSGELAPGERLPSIRDLARRFGIHANTVSSAYQQLHDERWVIYRRGSGVYVNPHLPITQVKNGKEEALLFDSLLYQAILTARKLGLTERQLMERVALVLAASRRLTLVESDCELVRLVLFEIACAGRKAPETCLLSPELFSNELENKIAGTTPVVLPSKAAQVRMALGEAVPIIVLQINPVASSMAAHLPLSREHLVAVVSHWPRFLETARAMLISSGFSPDALICRDAREAGWTAGLNQAAGIVCDSLTKTKLPSGTNALVFPLLSAEALEHFQVSRFDDAANIGHSR